MLLAPTRRSSLDGQQMVCIEPMHRCQEFLEGRSQLAQLSKLESRFDNRAAPKTRNLQTSTSPSRQHLCPGQSNEQIVQSARKWAGGFRRSRRCRRRRVRLLRRDSRGRCRAEEGRACRGWPEIYGVVLFLVRLRSRVLSSVVHQAGRLRRRPLQLPAKATVLQFQLARYNVVPQKRTASESRPYNNPSVAWPSATSCR